MAEEHGTTPIAGRSMTDGNGKNLAERLAAIGAKPVMAMEERSTDMPVALIVRDWLDGANEHYRRVENELTASWARKMLEIEEQRLAYMKRMLQALAENK